jgi:bis(5'-nucleosyl)-tetraphosphatase (symmetrical)
MDDSRDGGGGTASGTTVEQAEPRREQRPSVWAVGDVQGCFDALQALLEKIRFDRQCDTLWFTGDLVNRGPQSLETLRFVKNLGVRAIAVLGNHDLHLLAAANGQAHHNKHDTFNDVLAAPDRDELLDWLRHRPLLHHDTDLGWTLVHAGLLPQWDLTDAQRLATEAEMVLQGSDMMDFFAHMYGDTPDHWRADLRSHERMRVIVNAFTRLRYCDREGAMDLRVKVAPGKQPPDLVPWFQAPHRRSHDMRIVFGHWSTLGPYQGDNVLALDSGCLRGWALTAAKLHPGNIELVSIRCSARYTSWKN